MKQIYRFSQPLSFTVKIILFIFTISFFYSCKTAQKGSPVQTGKTERSSLPAANANPMSCFIKGKIIQILKPDETGADNICAKYSCKAKVKVLEVSGCGSSVSVPVNAGDTLEMKFAYTLQATKKILPDMRADYPGLNEGDSFTAQAEQRMKPGSEGAFIIYGYGRK